VSSSYILRSVEKKHIVIVGAYSSMQFHCNEIPLEIYAIVHFFLIANLDTLFLACLFISPITSSSPYLTTSRISELRPCDSLHDNSELNCTHGADSSWRRRTSQTDHLLDSKTQFQPMQRVADTYLLLNFLIGQRRHDGTALDVGMTRCHVPRRHTHP